VVLQTFILAAETTGLGCCRVSAFRNHAESCGGTGACLTRYSLRLRGWCVRPIPRAAAMVSMRLRSAVTVQTPRRAMTMPISRGRRPYDARRNARNAIPPAASNSVLHRVLIRACLVLTVGRRTRRAKATMPEDRVFPFPPLTCRTSLPQTRLRRPGFRTLEASRPEDDISLPSGSCRSAGSRRQARRPRNFSMISNATSACIARPSIGRCWCPIAGLAFCRCDAEPELRLRSPAASDLGAVSRCRTPVRENYFEPVPGHRARQGRAQGQLSRRSAFRLTWIKSNTQI